MDPRPPTPTPITVGPTTGAPSIVDLYQQLHERVIALGEDIERLFRAQYVGYRIGKRTICSVIPQKRRLRLVLPLDPVSHGDHPLTRDLRDVGHWGVGDTETTLESDDQLDQILVWVADAAAEARK